MLWLYFACTALPVEEPTSDWDATVRTRIVAGRYRFERSPADTFSAQNPAHGLGVLADGEGLRVDRGTSNFRLRSRIVGNDPNPGAWTTEACVAEAPVDERGDCVAGISRALAPGVSEWVRNGKAGIEQGFVASNSTTGDRFTIEVGLDGATATVSPTHALLSLSDGTSLRYDHLAAFDADGHTLPAWMEPSAGGLRLLVDTHDARFPVTLDPTISTGWIGEGDLALAYYGYSMASAGDVNADGYDDVIVGAYGYDDAYTDEGRVFVYFGGADGPDATADWSADGGQASAAFGFAVAGAGDVNGDGYDDIAIGAYLYDNGSTNEGRAWVYFGGALGPGSTYDWASESNQTSAYYGYAIAGAGDVNNDGYDDLLIGGYGYDSTYTDEGAVWLYRGALAGPGTYSPWRQDGGQASGAFGYDVAGAGDVDGDGYGDIVVGALNYDDGETNEGRAVVYYGDSGATPSTSTSLTVNQDYAGFGCSVDGAGDVDGDGYADVIVGAYAYDDGSTDEGEAFVFVGGASGVATSAAWTTDGGRASAYLGGAVAGAGDINGDGYADVVIGAYNDADGYASEGTAEVYLGSSAGLLTTATYTRWGGQASAQLGRAVAGAGDIDGDGFDDVLIGAPQWDGGKSAEGMAQLVYGSLTGPKDDEPWSWTWTAGSAGDELGYEVGGGGDVDGDGYDDVFLVAYSFAHLYGFGGSVDGVDTSNSMSLSGTYATQLYGRRVAVLGDADGDGYDDVVATSEEYDGSYTDQGKVTVYYGAAGGLSTSSSSSDTLYPYAESYAYFGSDADAAGDINGDGYADLVVGASGYNGGGIVTLFHGSSAGYASAADWSWQSSDSSAEVGTSTAGVGDNNGDGYADIAVTAPGWSGSEADEGGVFLFYGSAAGLSSSEDWSYAGGTASLELGQKVRGLGDLDADGYDELGVLCVYCDDGSALDGDVLIFHGSASGPGAAPKTTLSPETPGDAFGADFAGVGDLDADGYDDMAVGASTYDGLRTDEGRVSVWLGSPAGLGASADVDLQIGAAGALFGFAVAPAGDVDGDGDDELIVGAWGKAEVGADQGRAYVFDFTDSDGDGAFTWEDCDDADDTRSERLSEECDGIDNDCDGAIDEETPTWFVDADGDGYGDVATTVVSCTQPSGYVATGDDCDDADATQSPGATESCNGADDDCDGETDESAGSGGTVYYRDGDGDGDGSPATTATACSLPSGYAVTGGDCDDGDASVSSSASELCDTLDNDCDGETDEDSAIDAANWARDADGDGYGSATTYTTACEAPAGHLADISDCDDTDASVNPAATEVCDERDEDCDGTADDGVSTTYWIDADGDGYGEAASFTAACSLPAGYSADDDDCDDTDATVRPGGAESCNGIDDDCDGSTDEGVLLDWYLDADGDGWGDVASVAAACSLPMGYSATAGDCDDADSTVSPDAAESCNDADDDCDGTADDGVATSTWYADADGDGLGDIAAAVADCNQPSGHVAGAGDCDDRDARITDGETFYVDGDGDGFGDPSAPTIACDAEPGLVSDDTDCDDDDATIYPAARETWYDGVDSDCAGDSDYDRDGDAHDHDGYGGDDCDDADADVYPGAADAGYDGVDADCDGASDYDRDGDGQDTDKHGGTDCNDTDASVYAGAPDDPYDGAVTDCGSTWEYDADRDGYTTTEGDLADCDDTDATVHPGAEETWYDSIDQDCDGNDDDRDGDGVALVNDCDDNDATISEDCGGQAAPEQGCGCNDASGAAALLGLLPLVWRRRRGPWCAAAGPDVGGGVG